MHIPRWAVVALVPVLVFVVLASTPPAPKAQELVILGQLQGPVSVERFVDGDTLVLEGGERLRIIGVDTPEKGDPFADESVDFMLYRFLGLPLFLEFDATERDVFGRLLAYAYVEDPDGVWTGPDGTTYTQLNLAIAEAGLAVTLSIPPNVTYAEVYLAAVEDARSAGLGMWAGRECVDLNTGTREELMEIVHIGEERADYVPLFRPYTSLAGLGAIPGIGPKRLADIEEQGIVCALE